MFQNKKKCMCGWGREEEKERTRRKERPEERRRGERRTGRREMWRDRLKL